ncbi:hypothetical protein SEMRO_1644_G288150.1 [Seminavis robusta]|uniref:Uncharacterized protein n=1 Tax=Seminavis robusta TaxID=568900 RepID=A0A9N8HRZ1_9STRA|nr:hypothetical protein SEMRO_1644_G288150.1 [Seminavis robusta]|eukprot:Sro1644_g288150.1 n/a (227) ;mRNA; f:3601-4281
MHCAFLDSLGLDGNRLRKDAPKRHAQRYQITEAHSQARVEAISQAKGHGELFHVTQGQHLNSNDFFRAREHNNRQNRIKELEAKKESELTAAAVKDKRDAIVEEKGEPTVETVGNFTVAELQALHKYKTGKNGKGKKNDVLEAYLKAKNPRKLDGWSEEEEADLQRLKEEDIPLEETAIGEAVSQAASAVENHVAHLDSETQQRLLEALQNAVEFDPEEVVQDEPV